MANAKKTSFLLINAKQDRSGQFVKIGNEMVSRDSSALLLGVQFQDDLIWKTQIYGKDGVLSALNSRRYILRRQKSHLSMKSVLRMVDGIFTSKIRYGLQLLGKVRLNFQDPVCADLREIQLIQNKLLRTLNGTKIKDRVSTVSLLTKFAMLSVNQLNAQVKLLEMWKVVIVDDYPLLIKQQKIPATGMSTRASQKGRLIEIGKSNTTLNTSTSDAIRIWNLSPVSVTEAKTLYQAKDAIKIYVKCLPI